MVDYDTMTEETAIEFTRTKHVIQDYITYLVVKRKITKTPEELSQHLTELLTDSILTWSDPNE
jgi:hypothetical protein